MKVENQTTEAKMQSLFDFDAHPDKKAQYIEHAKCQEGKPCTYLCASEICDANAVTCANLNCHCQKDHNKNKLCLTLQLPATVDWIESKRQTFPDLLKWINKKYDQLIDWISEEREKIYLKTKSAGINEAQMNFLTMVYAGRCEELTGKKVHEVVKDLQIQNKKLEQTETLIIDRIEKQWKINAENIKKQVSAINQLIADAGKWEFSVEGLQSKVVVTEAQRGTVTEMLNSDRRRVLRYELLYRASENNFEVQKFWEKCDHKADTVTLIHTEFDKVIGGYTPLSWKKEKHASFEQDSSLRSFLFSVTEKAKFTLKESNKGNAIVHNTKFGPIFGEGHDIIIYNNANKNNSYANIGYSYENSKVQYKTKEAWQFFQGSTENWNFKIEEWEVWQVIFE